MNLQLNVIYVGGTVRDLELFLRSLLKWSTCRYRVVANACEPNEREHLRTLCEANPRLEFYELPGSRQLRHGEVLNHLQSLEETDHFGFIDSDMFATGEFLSGLVAGLNGHAAVFAGTHLGLDASFGTLDPRFQAVTGAYQETAEGLCLGSSHFAVYNNRILSGTIRDTGVTLDVCRSDALPVAVRDRLAALDAVRTLYDTGKAMNLLLQARGHRILFAKTPHLTHIGAISSRLLRRKQPSAGSRLYRLLCRIPSDQLRIECDVAIVAAQRLARGTSFPELWRMTRVHRRKDLIARYVLDVLESLRAGTPRPRSPFRRSRRLQEAVAAAADGIESLWSEIAAGAHPPLERTEPGGGAS